MKALQEVDWRILRWASKRGLAWAFELRAGSDVVALLRRQANSSTTAETADGYWMIVRSKLPGRPVRVFMAESNMEVAVITPKLMQDVTLTLSGDLRNRTLDWQRSIGPIRTEWAFIDSSKQRLLRFAPDSWHSSAQDHTGQVTLADTTRDIPELSLLAVLGIYLIESS